MLLSRLGSLLVLAGGKLGLKTAWGFLVGQFHLIINFVKSFVCYALCLTEILTCGATLLMKRVDIDSVLCDVVFCNSSRYTFRYNIYNDLI